MKAVLLISHGSRSPKTKEEIISLVKRLQARAPSKIFKYAFLEIEKPGIPEGIDLCVQMGADDITFLLNFLNSGKHVNEDIPAIVQEARLKYPRVHFYITTPIGQHSRITELFLDLLKDQPC